MVSPVRDVTHWLGSDRAAAIAFCAEVGRLLGRPRPPWVEIADCLRRHPQTRRSAPMMAALLRGAAGDRSIPEQPPPASPLPAPTRNSPGPGSVSASQPPLPRLPSPPDALRRAGQGGTARPRPEAERESPAQVRRPPRRDDRVRRSRSDPDIDAPMSTLAGRDPRDFTRGMATCPHNVPLAKRCRICNPDPLDAD